MDIETLAQEIVDDYQDSTEQFARFEGQFLIALENSRVRELVHSHRSRRKDPDHLRRKILRKYAECHSRGESFELALDNYRERINDLVGFRLLHLHSQEFVEIDRELKHLFEDENYVLVEGPFARTWDDESRARFGSWGVRCEDSASLYTSVHYVIAANRKMAVTAEIQVRTLSEELWGEVDHSFNYPEACASVACREQIKALARVTSSASRLVDSIFASYEAHQAGSV